MIYRASKDGFHAKNFHWKCDGKGPTFCLIKSKTGIISGAYTPIKWTSDKDWEVKELRKSFLFSVRPDNSVVKL